MNRWEGVGGFESKEASGEGLGLGLSEVGEEDGGELSEGVGLRRWMDIWHVA